MFSTTVFIIVAVGLISTVRGLAREHRSIYEIALKCNTVGWDADASALKGPDNTGGIIEDACTGFREFERCIIGVNPAEYASPIPNIVYLLIAYEWQHLVLAKKAGICKNVPIDQLKKITMESGILTKLNLSNIEEDSYEKCAGDAMRKCMFRAEKRMKQGISQDFLEATTDYISCYEEAGYTCDGAILRHFIAFTKAYRKQLEGEYGKMVEKIQLPPQ